jgi:hypothetical protein
MIRFSWKGSRSGDAILQDQECMSDATIVLTYRRIPVAPAAQNLFTASQQMKRLSDDLRTPCTRQ